MPLKLQGHGTKTLQRLELESYIHGMKQILGSFGMFLATAGLPAQSTFEAVYGATGLDLGFGVQQTTDGGYILSGVTHSEGNGSGDMYLVRTDANGVVQWTETYGTINLEIGYAVEQTADGGFAMCGMFNGFGSDTLTLVRTDASGGTLWVQHYPGTLGRDLGYALQQTSDGGFVVCGSSGFELDDAYIVRTDAAGDLVWSSTVDLGGGEMAMALQQTPDNGSIVLVQNSGFADPEGEVHLLRMDPFGDTLWTRTYATPGADEARGLAITSDGGYIIAGGNGYPNRDIQLIRTDALGGELWRRVHATEGDELAMDVQPMEDGGFIVCGRKENATTGDIQMHLFRTDASGVMDWERTFQRGIFSEANSLDRTSDGGFVLLGSTTDVLNGQAYTDMYLVKTDGAGYSAMAEGAGEAVAIPVYPNPATDQIWFELPTAGWTAASLVDPTGRAVRLGSFMGPGTATWDLDQYVNGTYMLLFRTEDGRRLQQRVVISR